ncbi:right-handed parallel beta-helix repeat-containing protein [Neobacillus mesonae]|nr:right-handed parallel beta-helix repeat-containing protein [Neobacillus mesonae]
MTNSLQTLIDNASDGEVLVVPEGKYVGPVVVDKKLTIIGDGKVEVRNTANKPAIEVRANHTSIENLIINHTYKGREAGVLINADHVILRDLEIHTEGHGIMLRDANYNLIQHNRIEGSEVQSLENLNQANGIDLYKSNHNDIQNNVIRYVMDGIYIESSQNIHVESNEIADVRYAVHAMYVKHASILNNSGQNNVTGAMVMEVQNAAISGNVFRKQSKNVNAQGMYLFDVHDSVIDQNTLEGNRVGFFIQSSSNNLIRKNTVIENFVGVQLISSKGNVIESNDFVSNVIEAAVMGSENNSIQHNYWDSSQGVDINGDGSSELSHFMNPFYQNLVSRNSAYQLFFQSPGMTFLSEMFTQDRNSWSMDSSPSMKANTQVIVDSNINKASSHIVLVAGLGMLCIALSIILFLGVKRS